MTPVPVGKALGMKHSCCQGEPLNAFLPFCVADDMGIVKQMFVCCLLENFLNFKKRGVHEIT